MTSDDPAPQFTQPTKIESGEASNREIAYEAPAKDSFTGSTIGGRFEVREKIGQGGMGSVYKVYHKQLKKDFACKVLQSQDGLSKHSLARFDQEAKAASELHHPNLVGLHDYGTTDDGIPYMVMDYVAGKSLSDMIKEKGPLPETTALQLFTQICDGLAYAHKKRVLHRDVKPSNIMITDTSGTLTARILDFGIAKLLPAEGTEGPHLTQTGEVVGSPHYMSPEQCMGYTLDERSDIYSLGCVMFETLTGKPPFAGDNSVQVIFKHLNERPPLFKTVASSTKIRAEIEKVVMQTLEKDRENRYQSLDDLKKDLQLLLSGKNPVKEVSEARRRFKALANFAKYGSAVLLIVASTLFLKDKLVAPNPEWVQLTYDARGQKQLGVANYPIASVKYRKALATAEKLHAPPADVEQICMEMAFLYQDQKNWEAAEIVLKKGLQVSSRHAPNQITASLHDTLAQTYLDEGKWADAAEEAKVAIDQKKATLGLDHILTEHSYSRLGKAYRNLKKYQEAEAADKTMIEIANKVFPNNDDPRVADAYIQYAYLLADEGKSKESIEAGQKALALSTQLLGADDRKTKKYKNWLDNYVQKNASASPKQ